MISVRVIYYNENLPNYYIIFNYIIVYYIALYNFVKTCQDQIQIIQIKIKKDKKDICSLNYLLCQLCQLLLTMWPLLIIVSIIIYYVVFSHIYVIIYVVSLHVYWKHLYTDCSCIAYSDDFTHRVLRNGAPSSIQKTNMT